MAALDVSKVEITPYQDAVVAESLIRNEIKAGKVTNTTKNDKLGTNNLNVIKRCQSNLQKNRL